MEFIKQSHARRIEAGGGYKIPLYIKEGGCYQVEVASFTLQRKEVDAK